MQTFDELLAFAQQQATSASTNVQLLWAGLKSPVIRANAAD